METESVKSGHSEHSSRSRRTRGLHGTHFNHSNMGPPIGLNTTPSTNNNNNPFLHTNHVLHRNHHHSHRSRHSHKSVRSDRILGGGMGNLFSTPSSTKGPIDLDVVQNGSIIGGGGGGGGGSGDEVIEVQILPQNDNWGDNTTAITGNTSEHSDSADDIRRFGRDGYGNQHMGTLFRCHRYIGSVTAALLSAIAFTSPLAMVVIPKMQIFDWKEENLECGPECDSALISFSFKLLILIVGTWALFFRQPKATMPRIFIFRAIILAFVFVFVFSYWLFYSVRVIDRRDEVTYYSVVQFAVSLVDALLFIHYLAIILIELRHLQPQYSVKVVRSPDGESHHYNMGQLSIQRAAVWVLEKYYRDFSIYNPYLERLPSRNHKSTSGLKFYDVDGTTRNNLPGSQSRSVTSANTRRRDSSHNERFYEEHEYERRVKKRRSRLLTATEEAFVHIKRLHEEPGPAIPMDPMEAAQAIFPSMSRALQKYLRITRQQPRHSMESILEHLATCLSYDLSPRAFLEKYIVTTPVLQSDREHRPIQTWGLVCDILLSRAIEDGTVFQLRHSDVSLLCTVSKIPHFNVTEEIIDPKRNKFVLRLNSETSV